MKTVHSIVMDIISTQGENNIKNLYLKQIQTLKQLQKNTGKIITGCLPWQLQSNTDKSIIGSLPYPDSKVHGANMGSLHMDHFPIAPMC